MDAHVAQIIPSEVGQNLPCDPMELEQRGVLLEGPLLDPAQGGGDAARLCGGSVRAMEKYRARAPDVKRRRGRGPRGPLGFGSKSRQVR